MTTQTSLLLLRAAGEVRSVFAKNATDKFTLPQAVTLLAVCESPGIKQIDLLALTGSDRSTMSAMLRRMEHAGWIIQTRDENDMRAVLVTPTKSGRIMRKKAADALEKTSMALSSRVRGAKQSVLCSALQEIVGVADV